MTYFQMFVLLVGAPIAVVGLLYCVALFLAGPAITPVPLPASPTGAPVGAAGPAGESLDIEGDCP